MSRNTREQNSRSDPRRAVQGRARTQLALLDGVSTRQIGQHVIDMNSGKRPGRVQIAGRIDRGTLAGRQVLLQQLTIGPAPSRCIPRARGPPRTAGGSRVITQAERQRLGVGWSLPPPGRTRAPQPIGQAQPMVGRPQSSSPPGRPCCTGTRPSTRAVAAGPLVHDAPGMVHSETVDGVLLAGSLSGS